MPSVEAGEVEIFLFRNDILVESLVVRVLQSKVLQALVFLVLSIANDLNLGLMRNGLQIWMKHGTLCIQGFAVAISGGLWVELLGKQILCLWSQSVLVLENNDLVGV